MIIDFKSSKANFANQFTHKDHATVFILAIILLLLAILTFFIRTTQDVSSILMTVSYFIWADLCTAQLCKTRLPFLLCLLTGAILPGLFLLIIEVIMHLILGS